MPGTVNLAKYPWLQRDLDPRGVTTTAVFLSQCVPNCILNSSLYTHRLA